MKSLATNINQYYCLIGKLIFLTITKSDIAYTVNRLSSYMAQPQEAYLNAAKHVLRYLQGTLDYSILYRADASPTITGYTDVDWGSYLETQWSMEMYIFTLVGGPIIWQSKNNFLCLALPLNLNTKHLVTKHKRVCSSIDSYKNYNYPQRPHQQQLHGPPSQRHKTASQFTMTIKVPSNYRTIMFSMHVPSILRFTIILSKNTF